MKQSQCQKIAQVARSMLPSGSAVVCRIASAALDIPWQERLLVAHAVPARIAEFVGGRWCAHRAMRELGFAACELIPGPLGAPSWPAGVLGSITHEAGICLAVVTPQSEGLTGMGIDLVAGLRAAALVGLADLFLSPAESQQHAQRAFSAVHLAELFCAKEATVKAVSALAGRYLDPAAITVWRQEAGFSAAVVDLPFSVSGQLAHIEDQILAAACC